MSMYASLVDTIKSTKVEYGLSDEQATELLVSIMGDLEWDFDGIDYNNEENWEESERLAAKKALGL
jgi:hypothetical protein